MYLIALTGYKGSGKTTLAKLLGEKHGHFPVPFADPIKKMLHLLLREQGVELNLADRMIYGDLKETPTEFFANRSPRYAQQTLGTEWGRELMNQNIWTDIWENRVKHLQETTGQEKFVVDDLRFQSEARRIREHNGLIIKIRRPDVETSDPHASEQEISSIRPNWTIMNDDTPICLLDDLDTFLRSRNPR